MDFVLDATVCKVDASLGMVLGWGITCLQDGNPVFDLQDDHIPEASMLKAASGFMQGARSAKAMHDGESVGTIVFAWPMTSDIAKAFGVETKTTGLMVAMKPEQGVLEKFQSGEFTGFSIGGRRLVDEVISEDGTSKLMKYDESEARDDHGMWTSGGTATADRSPGDAVRESAVAVRREGDSFHFEDRSGNIVHTAQGHEAMRDMLRESGLGGASTEVRELRSGGRYVLKYDENQARDESGKWSAGGGASGGSSKSEAARHDLQSDWHLANVNTQALQLRAASEKLRAAQQSGLGDKDVAGFRQAVEEAQRNFDVANQGLSDHYARGYTLKAAFGAQPRTSGQYMSGTVQGMHEEHASNEGKISAMHAEPDGKKKNAKHIARLVGRNAELRHLISHARTEGY